MRYLATITMLVLAMALVQPVAAQSFKPDYNAGLAAYLKCDDATALKHWRPLAEQGHAKAQYFLGLMHANGQGVTRDYKEAVRWYRMAAKQGDAYAQYWLGEMYRDCEGVMQDRVMTIILLYYQGQIRVNPCRRKCFWRSRTCSHTS